ncbi:MAG: hypothetical protein B7Y93_04525 [Micrococcales bacterium 32-70-13]|nr:MAG: hypothetical protein B7Y93_04525 [Micrococcales bacterium 32-70-13]
MVLPRKVRLFRRPSPSAPVHPPLEVTLDVYWCDAHGTQVSGWAHSGGQPVEGLTLTTRSGSAETTVVTRTDLPKFFGDEPAMESAGFEVYLPGPPMSSSSSPGVSTTRS